MYPPRRQYGRLHRDPRHCPRIAEATVEQLEVRLKQAERWLTTAA
jgi:hypothetical protein